MRKKKKPIDDQCKCPACAWRIAPTAYRCPNCFIYFCYKCRSRISKGEQQYQCANQSCDLFGKLVCRSCTGCKKSKDLKVNKLTDKKLDYDRCIFYLAHQLKIEPESLLGICKLLGIPNVQHDMATLSFSQLKKVLEHMGRIPKVVIDYRVYCAQCKHPVKVIS